MTTDSVAVYGDASLQLTSSLRAALGLRYSFDKRDYRLSQTINGQPAADFSATEDWSALTPRFVLQWFPAGRESDAPSDKLMVYLNISRGYKAGGFNTVVPQPEPFASEFLLAYEVGARRALFNGRSNLHVSAYYYDYDDIQLQIIPAGSLTPFAPVQNAGTATSQGFEVAWDVQANGYVLNLTAAWLRATFDDLVSVDFNDPAANPDRSGNRLPRSPEFSASLRASKKWLLKRQGTLTAGVSYNYQDQAFFSVFEDPLVSEGSFSVWGAWLNWSSNNDRFDAIIYGRNLSDSTYSHNAFRARNQVGVIKALTAPRTYGVEIGLHF